MMYNGWDDDDDEMASIDELLRAYFAIKNGQTFRFIEEDEYEMLIEYFYQDNQDQEALTACELGLNYHPFSSAILMLQAELLYQSQKYKQAIAVLDHIDQMEQHNKDALLLRSDVLLAQYKYDQAAQLLESKANDYQSKEDKIAILHELADVYDENEQFEAVFDVLSRILHINPRDEEALHKVGFWADFGDKNEESIKLHEELIENDPFNAFAWFNLGAAYQALKLYEKSIDAYEYCVAIDEKFEFAYRNMSDAYIKLRWYDKAIEVLERDLEFGKPEDVLFEALGLCYEKKKQFAKARSYYREVTKLNPADDIIYFKIGETYAKEQQWEKAIKSYTVALKINNKNGAYSMAIGNCLMEMGAEHEAVTCYLNAVRLKPNSKTVWVALIKGLYINGYYEEALAQLSMAKNCLGDKPDFFYLHTAILFAKGKTKEAMIQLENGLTSSIRKLNVLTSIQPDVLQRKSVMDLVARYKKK